MANYSRPCFREAITGPLKPGTLDADALAGGGIERYDVVYVSSYERNMYRDVTKFFYDWLLDKPFIKAINSLGLFTCKWEHSPVDGIRAVVTVSGELPLEVAAPLLSMARLPFYFPCSTTIAHMFATKICPDNIDLAVFVGYQYSYATRFVHFTDPAKENGHNCLVNATWEKFYSTLNSGYSPLDFSSYLLKNSCGGYKNLQFIGGIFRLPEKPNIYYNEIRPMKPVSKEVYLDTLSGKFDTNILKGNNEFMGILDAMKRKIL